MKEIGRAREIRAKELYLHHRRGNPLEEALLIKELQDLEFTQHRIGKEMDLTQGQVSKRLRLLQLTPTLQERVKTGALRPSTAYQLSKLPKEIQKKLEHQDEITLRQAEFLRRNEVITKEIMELLDTEINLPSELDPNYENTYRAVIELKESLEMGKPTICENHLPNLIDELTKCLNAAFQEAKKK